MKKAYAQNCIQHADYRRCLISEERKGKQQLAAFNIIRSKKHVVQSLEIQKVGLCAYDNKRYLLNDVDSLAYGHVGISAASADSSAVSAEDSSAASGAANGV